MDCSPCPDRWHEFRQHVGRAFGRNLEAYHNGQFYRDLLRIAELGADCAHIVSPDVRSEILGDVASVLYPAFATFDPNQPFQPWATAVMRNHAVSKLRENGRRRAEGSVDHLAAREPARFEAAAEGLAEAFAVLRRPDLYHRLFPAGADGRRGADAVDSYAVFVFEYRLRAGAEIEKLGFVVAPDVWADWQPRELVRRVKPGWPTVGEMWQRAVSEPFRPLAKARFCLFEHLAERIESGPRPRVSTWLKWVERTGHGLIRPLVGEEAWRMYFARLFPKYKQRPE